MTTLIILYLLFLAAVLVVIVFKDARSGIEELLSLRNFFILGLLIFQITGGAFVLAQEAKVGYFIPNDIPGAALSYAMKITVFVVLFLVAGRMATGPIDRFYGRKNLAVYKTNPFLLLAIATAAIPVGLFTQFVIVYVPVIGPATRPLAFGMFAVAAGLATWAAAPRLKNPAILLPAAAIVLFCLMMTFYQAFGRRNLIGIVTMVVWAGYYCHWRSLGTTKLILRLGSIGTVGFVIMLALTSVRSGDFREQGIVENISSLRQARLGDGIGDILAGQGASMSSMWLIESRPGTLDYDTLHSARLFLLMPIPRRLWPGKPDGLGLTMPQTEIYIPNKPHDYNIGPGLIGHIENDNPWIALWLYPIFFGIFFRVLDRTMVWLYYNPFIILPVGTAIGQVVAMPRGELGTFFFHVILNIAGGFVIIKTIAGPLLMLGIIKRYQPDDEELGPDAVEYDEGYGYDEPYSESPDQLPEQPEPEPDSTRS